MGKFRTNKNVLVKIEAISKALREQHRWPELSKFDDMCSKYNSIYHLYGVIEYESSMRPGSYYVDIPGSGLDSSVRINEEDLSPYDLSIELERLDTDGDSEELKSPQDILNRVIATSGMIITSDGKKYYLKSYEDLKGDKTKMGAYIPDNLLPKQIIYSNPATIVFWGDGSKTVVKVSDKENFNPYYGFCAALAKKVYGNNSLVNKIVGGGVYDTPKDKKKKKPQKDIPGKNSGTIPNPKTVDRTDSYWNTTVTNPFDIFSKEFDRIIAQALDIRREDKGND